MDFRPSVETFSPVVVPTGYQRVPNFCYEYRKTSLHESALKSSDCILKGLTDDKNNNFMLYRDCNMCSGPLQQDEDDLSIQDMDVEVTHNVNSTSPIIKASSKRLTSTSKLSILDYCIEKCTPRNNAAAVKETNTVFDDFLDFKSCKDAQTSYLHANDLNSLMQQFKAIELNTNMRLRNKSEVILNGKRRRISQEESQEDKQISKAFETKSEKSLVEDQLPSSQKEERSLKRRKLNQQVHNYNIKINIIEKKNKTIKKIDMNKTNVVSRASAVVGEEKSKPVAPKTEKRSFNEEDTQTVLVKKIKPNLQDREI